MRVLEEICSTSNNVEATDNYSSKQQVGKLFLPSGRDRRDNAYVAIRIGTVPREVLKGGVMIDCEDRPAEIIAGIGFYAPCIITLNTSLIFSYKPERWIVGSSPEAIAEGVELAEWFLPIHLWGEIWDWWESGLRGAQKCNCEDILAV